MRHRVLGPLAAAALACWCASCGGGTSEGLYPVNGKVLCNGQPATGAVLYFHRQAGGDAPPPGAAEIIPSAKVQDDGRFTVESPPLGYGAAPGKYALLVQWPDDFVPAQARAADKPKIATVGGKKVTVVKRDKLGQVPGDRLKGRYMDKSKPLLQAEIKPGSNDLGTLELEIKN
jgi:hypothetical protein